MMLMTEADAIQRATEIAREHGFPWSPAHVVARRRRIWPFPAHWRIQCRVTSPHNATVDIGINDRDGRVTHSGVVYNAVRALR